MKLRQLDTAVWAILPLAGLVLSVESIDPELSESFNIALKGLHVVNSLVVTLALVGVIVSFAISTVQGRSRYATALAAAVLLLLGLVHFCSERNWSNSVARATNAFESQRARLNASSVTLEVALAGNRSDIYASLADASTKFQLVGATPRFSTYQFSFETSSKLPLVLTASFLQGQMNVAILSDSLGIRNNGKIKVEQRGSS